MSTRCLPRGFSRTAIRLAAVSSGSAPGGIRRLTIVGVAQTVPQAGPPELVRPVVYAPLQADAAPEGRATIVVNGNLSAAAAALRDEVRALDPNLPLFGIETLDTAVARSRIPVRLVGTWFGVLALVALILASVGLYALTAHGVAQRMHEIGVRMALGAQAPQVVWLFLRRTIVQLAVGVTLGLAGALGVGQLLQIVSARHESARSDHRRDRRRISS